MKKDNGKGGAFNKRGPNALWLALLCLGMFFGYLLWYRMILQESNMVRFSTLLTQIDEKNVESVRIYDQTVEGIFIKPIVETTDGGTIQVKGFRTIREQRYPLVEKLHENKITVEVVSLEGGCSILPGVMFLVALIHVNLPCSGPRLLATQEQAKRLSVTGICPPLR